MPSDVELLEQWIAGDEHAGDRLLRTYRDRLHRFFEVRVSRDAEDLVQRTLLKCAEGRTRIRQTASFRAFLFGVARNVLLQHLSGRRTEHLATDFSDVASVDPGPSPSRVVASREEQRILQRALEALPDSVQMVLDLHYWEGLNTQEIADALSMPRSTVTTQLHRARNSLREMIQSVAGRPQAKSSLLQELTVADRGLQDSSQH